MTASRLRAKRRSVRWSWVRYGKMKRSLGGGALHALCSRRTKGCVSSGGARSKKNSLACGLELGEHVVRYATAHGGLGGRHPTRGRRRVCGVHHRRVWLFSRAADSFARVRRATLPTVLPPSRARYTTRPRNSGAARSAASLKVRRLEGFERHAKTKKQLLKFPGGGKAIGGGGH